MQLSGAIAQASAVQVTNPTRLTYRTIQLTMQVSIVLGPQPTNYSNGVNVRSCRLVPESEVWRIARIITSF